MKKLVYIAFIALLCACSSNKNSRSVLFGNIAKEINDYQAKQKELTIGGDSIEDKSKMAEMIKESDKLNEKFLPKIQKAVEKENGQELEIDVNTREMEITEPICIYFTKPLEVIHDGFWEDMKFNLQANFHGSIKTVSNFQIGDGVKLSEMGKMQLVQPVSLIGYDSANNEIFHSLIGYFPVTSNDSLTYITKGSQMIWLPLNYDNSLSADYVKLDKLKIIIDK